MQVLCNGDTMHAFQKSNQAYIRCLEDIIDNEKLISKERKLLNERNRRIILLPIYSLVESFLAICSDRNISLVTLLLSCRFFMLAIWSLARKNSSCTFWHRCAIVERSKLSSVFHCLFNNFHKEIFEIEKVLFFS